MQNGLCVTRFVLEVFFKKKNQTFEYFWLREQEIYAKWLKCASEREFPAVFKTHLTFNSSLIFVGVILNMGTFFGDILKFLIIFLSPPKPYLTYFSPKSL